MLGLTASATVRLSAGFLTFLIAFGLRRGHAAAGWYGFAFAASGGGCAPRPLPRRAAPSPALRAVAARLGPRDPRARRPRRAAYFGTIAAQVALAVLRGDRGRDLAALVRRAHPASSARARPGRACSRASRCASSSPGCSARSSPSRSRCPSSSATRSSRRSPATCLVGYVVGRLVVNRATRRPATTSRKPASKASRPASSALRRCHVPSATSRREPRDRGVDDVLVEEREPGHRRAHASGRGRPRALPSAPRRSRRRSRAGPRGRASPR